MTNKIAEAFRIFSQHWGLFACLVLTLWLPANLVINILDYQVFAEDDYISALRLGILLDGTIGALPLAAILMSLLRFERGESVTYTTAMYDGFSRFIRVIVVNICVGIMIVGLGFISFLIFISFFDSGESHNSTQSYLLLLSFGVGTILAVGLIYLLLRFALVNVAVVTENLGPIMGMKKSYAATKGILFSLVLISVVSYPLIFLVGFVLYLPLFLVEFIETILLPSWSEILYSSLVDSTTDVLMVLPTIIFFLYYRDQMWLKQSPNLEEPMEPNSGEEWEIT